MSDNENPFVPGLEVALVAPSRWHRGEITLERRKIAKIYATGRFILEGDTQRRQYRPLPSGDGGRWTARWTGAPLYAPSPYVETITPELIQKHAASQRRSAFGAVASRAEKSASVLARNPKSSAALLKRLSRIADEVEAMIEESDE